MGKRTKGRGRFLSRHRRVTAVGVLAVGAVLISLGLSSDWIDLAALALAAASLRPAGADRPGRTPRPGRHPLRRLRRKNPSANRRTPRDPGRPG
ncbi:hypothetical protein GCM10011583_52710 [Streptomyces camponoticapitis]|uniref:Uncharacterized protein n=1 Tax=Streptomyces camponoticapitis TaxID=1616125 RepID=A0ABQ2EJU1_9ACTN|nr:hypothetical protein [Streptomyces camponoticapitis]GGK14207.1 hypothetical protein GCM10011583_52710 [Streptomyces camponoticapitis]